MPFVRGKSGNPHGRPTADKLINPKSVSGNVLREKEFKQILRRLKPLTGKAIIKLQDLIEADGTTENTRMRAIAFVLTEYEKLMNEVYKPVKGENFDEDDDEEDTPVVSLRVLNGGKS